MGLVQIVKSLFSCHQSDTLKETVSTAHKNVAQRDAAAESVGATWGQVWEDADIQLGSGGAGGEMIAGKAREKAAADYCTHGDNVKRGWGVP